MKNREAPTLTYCRSCGKMKNLSGFRYIQYFQEYRSICKDCEAQQRRRRKLERKTLLAKLRAQRTQDREELQKEENASIVGHALGLVDLQAETDATIDVELRGLQHQHLRSCLHNLLRWGWLLLAVTFSIFWFLQFHQFSWLSTAMLVVTALSCTAIIVSSTVLHQVMHEYILNYLSALREKELAQNETHLLRQSLKEKSSGFPTLIDAMKRYDEKKDEFLARYLQLKKHSSVKASEVLREEASRRREAESNYLHVKAIIDYYESIAPFLMDLKDDISETEEEIRYREFDREEESDPATNYLTKEEYRTLNSADKSQLALDRYWKRPKSKRSIGRIYERYVGYLYEDQGYDVEYVGIFKGVEDLGRDLICRKDNETIVVQCKYWAQFRTIYEKHIFQFFGTVFQYKDENSERHVRGIFYTTTQLSSLAHRFASQLGIEVKENFKFDESYPSIKCNVSRIDGSKIYHLPFDQQYDKVKVERNRGEFYCSTTQESESKGFQRAKRWRGQV